MSCPYCGERVADSRDHVFADFLGGKIWIWACVRCNNEFGHSIEAGTFAQLKNLMFHLRRSGMQPPKPMVWKGLGLGANGQRYDVDQDLQLTRSTPTIERDEAGQISHATGSLRHVEQIKKSLDQNGRPSRIVREAVTIDLRRLQITFPLDDNIKRVCLKMSIATAEVLGARISLDRRAREYLLKGHVEDVCPVRIATTEYFELERRRPAVGHLVYVRAASSEGRAYSIVQLFGVFQFYCELSNDYDGTDWAAVATHSPVDHSERIDFMPNVDYPLPNRYVSGTLVDHMEGRLERLRLELVKLYGDQAPERISAKAW